MCSHAQDRELRSQMARPVVPDRRGRVGTASPHPATLEDAAAGKRRVIPTSVAPITFFIREDADWMTPHNPAAEQTEARGLSEAASGVHGFPAATWSVVLRRYCSRHRKAESRSRNRTVGTGGCGVVTADGFENLRSLIDPKRRAGLGSGRASRPRHSAGRWALALTRISASRRKKQPKPLAGCCLTATASSFATCWPAKPICRNGGICRWLSAGWKTAAKFAAANLSTDFWGSSSRLPVAVESLRATRKLPPSGETVTLSAADPLNLVGILVPGERVPAISGRSWFSRWSGGGSRRQRCDFGIQRQALRLIRQTKRPKNQSGTR